MDANGNGSMEFEEFLELMTEHMEVDESEENMRDTFNVSCVTIVTLPNKVM